jgi:hypothetical protein
MHKSLVALAIIGAASVPASAQTTQAAPATANQTAPATANPTQLAKPQTVKKRVCEQIDEDSYSRLGSRKICKTIEVPVTNNGTSGHEQPSTSTGQSH